MPSNLAPEPQVQAQADAAPASPPAAAVRWSLGEVIATSVDDLHSANNKLGKQTSLTEKGNVVPSGGSDGVNMHDILTGTQPDGRAIAGNVDTNCSNWTSSTTGAAAVTVHGRTVEQKRALASALLFDLCPGGRVSESVAALAAPQGGGSLGGPTPSVPI